MKEKITQLSRERFEYELPELICSVDKLEIDVETGQTIKGSFTIKNAADRYMKGVLYSSSHLLCLEEDSFVGAKAKIGYCFHAEDVRARDTVKGAISIVSSCGEKELPFEIRITDKVVEASFGEVRDLFHFTNLAKMDWMQAVGIFKSPNFKDIFLKKDVEMQNLYDGLIAGENENQALEEFLVSIQKKETTRLAVDQTEISCQVKKEDASETITVRKDNWGFLDVDVLCEQEFVQIGKKHLSAMDFIGDRCQIQIEIKNSALRPGKNYATIVLQSYYQKIEIPVLVEKIVKHMERDYDETKMKHCEVTLISNYIAFRNNLVAVEEYVKEMRDAITKLEGIWAVKKNLGEVGYSRKLDLYQMHLYMVEGNQQKALEILKSLEEEQAILHKNAIEEYCGYLYLKSLFTRADSDLQYAVREIRECYKQKENSWIILWFLLFLDEKYEQDPKEKLKAIEKQFSLGCTSPVIYYEACNVISEDPTLLTELTPCMIQVMNLGVKYWMFSENVVTQYACLAERMKQYDRVVMNNLVKFYNKYQSKECLNAICSMLIKSDMSDATCFHWYETGVKEKLKLTQLYEYYMYSIDEEYKGLLPQDVYIYFSYNTTLLEEKKSFLYANIVDHREQLEDIYPLYVDQIKAYVRQQLKKHKIDRHLAVLYRMVFSASQVTASVAEDLPQVLFKQRVHCEHKNMVGVYVIHKECPEGVYVSFNHNHDAYVDIFTDKAKIFLVDDKGCRYETSIPWTVEKMMKRHELAEACFRLCPDNRMLCLYLYERISYYHNQTVDAKALQHYMDPNWMKPEYGKKWIMGLIQNYYDNYEGEALEALLLEVDLHGMKRSERNLITEYCIIRGLYDLAYEQIKEYSFEGVSVKRLRALCSKQIKKITMDTEDTLLAKMSFYVFKAGKYDEMILKYLVRYYLGTTKDMFLIWREAKEYDIETVDLEERLLGQILFAESYVQDAMAVFFSFYESGRNRTLIKAFVNYYAYKYLVRDRVLNEDFFIIVKKEWMMEKNRTLLYALLKYYSTLEQWNKEQREWIEEQVLSLLQEGIIFPFFKSFTREMRFPGGIENMQFVEYKTDPKHTVLLHYSVEDEEVKDGFEQIQMQNMYEGIFVKSFMLFYNESLQYYVEELSKDEEPYITESTVIRGDQAFVEEEDDVFGQINMMLIAREMKDESTLLTLLENYQKNEYTLEHAFKML